MDIVGKKYIFLSISGFLVLASIFAVSFWGLKLGIDFTGGSLLEVEFKETRPDISEIKQAVGSLAGEVVLQPAGERNVILRMRHIDEDTHGRLLRQLAKLAPLEEKKFVAIGPIVGGELKRKSLIALSLAIFVIIFYISWAFRKSAPVRAEAVLGEKPPSSWKYGFTAILALVHDILIPTGIFSALGRFYGIQIDIFFVTALLTIMGFSVHDTIVVFDRIRENLRNLKTKEPFAAIVNRSINDTMARSINTSLTTLLVLIAVLFLGGETTRLLALALSLGMIFGTYSSIFVASPLLVVWQSLTPKR